MKRKKLPSLKSLQAKADAAWRDVVLGNRLLCAVCEEPRQGWGTTGKLAEQAHHIFHKKMYNLFRYDIRNGLPICRGCHHLDKYRPAATVVAAIRFMGIDNFMALVEEIEAFNEPKRWSRKELNAILEALEARKAMQCPTEAEKTSSRGPRQ